MEIFGFEEGATTVNFNAKGVNYRNILLRSYWAQDIVRPIIEYKLVQRRLFPLHGGAVSKDSSAYIFTGRAGVFKTTLIMDLVRKAGFGYLGDERVIMGEEEILCFPASLFLFNYTLKHSATEDMGIVSKLRLFRQMISGEEKYETPVVRFAMPTALFFIERKDRLEVRCTKLSLRQAITKMIANNKLELSIHSPILSASHFLDYMLAYSFVFPRSMVATFWDTFTDGLGQALNGIPIYLLKMPVDYDMNTFESVRKYLGSI